METEKQVVDVLNRIVNGEFDHSIEKIDHLLDQCQEVLESLKVFDRYDEDRDSVLHNAVDKLSTLLIKEADPFIKSEQNTLNVIEGLLRYNYFPNQKRDSCELPPLFSSEKLSLDILQEVFEVFESEDYFTEQYSHGVAYHASKPSRPRALSIPEPAAYMQMLNLIYDHYDDLTTVASNRNLAAIEAHDDGRVLVMDYDSGCEQKERAANLSFGKRYRVHADIKQCFANINTDVMSKAIAASDVDRSIETHSGFDVWQGWREQGLPIGPGASNILADFVLATIDAEMHSINPFSYYRFIDDYVCFTDDLDEANQFVAQLTMVLSRFGIQINIEKTRIVKLPQPLEPEWMLDLYTRIPHIIDRDWCGDKILRFLDYALVLANKHPDQFVMKYALKCVLNIINVATDDSLVRYLVNLLPFYPELSPYFGHVYRPENEAVCHDETLCEHINDCLAVYVKEKRSDATCWVIYWMTQFDITIFPENLDGIIQSYDTMPILSLYANGIRKEEIIEYANSYCVSNAENIEGNWLLLYQLYLDGVLVDDDYFELDSVYQILKESNVSFIDTNHAKEVKSFLDGYIDEDLEKESNFYINPPQNCDICNVNFDSQKYFIDGQTIGGPFGFMCESCVKEHGVGIGYGKGQLYKRNGKEWVLVAGA